MFWKQLLKMNGMSCNEKWNISYYIALFASYFYAKDYSNSTMMADFMMNLWKKEKNLPH